MSVKHINTIRKLLPPGLAWAAPVGSFLYKLAEAMGVELERVESRIAQLLLESDPRTTYDLLEQWEKVFGLPGECLGDEIGTLEERRAAIVAKLTSRNSLTKSFYVALAATLGYTITVDDIVEFDAFVAGDPCDEPCYDDAWAFAFAITFPENVTRYFRASLNGAGDRLAEFGDDLLECTFNHNKAAHTQIIFQYA